MCISLKHIFIISSIFGLILRVWGVEFGLPYFFHPDEGHYLPRALIMLKSGDINPHYFMNPPFLTYVYALCMMIYFVIGYLLGTFNSIADFLIADPTTFYIISRLINAFFSFASCFVLARTGNRLSNGIP